MSEDENMKIQRITDILEKGGTMLATHHDCGAPLFRYQGKVLCPVCSYQEKQEKTGKIEAEPEYPKKDPLKTGKKTGSLEYRNIEVMVKNTVLSTAASLEDETDLQRVRDKMECIERGIKILKLLES